MRYIPWPENVPSEIMLPLQGGGPQDNRLSFETDYGLDISRPRASWAPEVYDVEIGPLTKPEFIAFEAWFRRDLAWGVHAFILDHPITDAPAAWRPVPGNQAYQVRTLENPKYDRTRVISVSMQIRSVPLTSDFWDIVNA